MPSPVIDVGFYGKVPARGDFVSRRLPRSFVEPWDLWLQASLTASREVLGETWLDRYLTAPLWRFALSSDVCGPDAYAGVLMPSVDQVGRYFPLTVAANLSRAGNVFELLVDAQNWYGQVEEVALTCQREVVLENFDERVAQLSSPLISAGGSMSAWTDRREAGCYVFLESLPEAGSAAALLADYGVRAALGAYGLWWTSGSEKVARCVVLVPGLPSAAQFSSFLDGDWGRTPCGRETHP